MSLFIETEVDVPFSFDWEEIARKVIDYTIEHEDFPYEAEVNLTLTDNEGIHEVNKNFRQIDRPTDVLSFPMLSYEQAGDFPDWKKIMMIILILIPERSCWETS